MTTTFTPIIPSIPDHHKASMKEAMDWMDSFYTTITMIRAGYKVHEIVHQTTSDGKRIMGVYAGVKGDEYKHGELKKEYEEDMKKWNSYTESQRRGAPESKPREPLSPEAFSFFVGSCEDCEFNSQIVKFDRTTLLKIIVAHVSVVSEELSAQPHSELVKMIEFILSQESEKAEMDNKYHSVGELMSGIVLSTNWQWLSDADLKKMAMAHGDWSSDSRKEWIWSIRKNQIKLLQEIVDKRYSQEGRGYDVIRARLYDNKQWAEFPVTDDDNPNVAEVREKRKRKRQEECSHDDVTRDSDDLYMCNECDKWIHNAQKRVKV
jgi:hypothetical protein